jgi:tetratricopeptide (TPR) repeat protein
MRTLLAGIAFTLLAVLPMSAQESPRDLWAAATAAAESGDAAEAKQRLSTLLQQGQARGIRRFPAFAESALALSRSAAAQNDAATASWALAAAQQLDPISPQVAFAQADRSLAAKDFAGTVRHLGSALVRTFRDDQTARLTRTDLFIVLLLALLATIVCFAVALLFRYARQAAHDFREMLARRFSPGVTTVLAAALLFLPLFLWLGPIWLVVYWLAIFFRYAHGAERVVTVISLIVLAVTPLLLHRATHDIAGAISPVVAAANANRENVHMPETIKRVRLLSEAAPEDARVRLLLGNLEVQEGNEAEAMVQYKQAAQLDPQLAGAFINQGNLHFHNGDFQTAIREYQRALEIDSTMALAHYNHSVASGKLYRFDEQGQRLAEARKYDKSLVEAAERAGARGEALPLTYTLRPNEAWSVASAVASIPAAREVFGNYVHFRPLESLRSPLTLAAVLGLLAATALFLQTRKKGVAGSCIKCGRTFCSRCKSARESATYCTQCIHIYLKKDGVALDTKKSKLLEFQQHQAELLREKKILATFSPGLGSMYDGSVLKGLPLALLFFVLVATAIFVGRLAPVAWTMEALQLVVRIVAISLAVILWFATTLRVYRQRSAG